MVLSGVSFCLRPGDALILRGPNGIGKSTLLRAIAGLAPLEEGALTLEPEALVYAGHLDALKSQLSLRENLLFWAAIYAQPKARVAALIEELALSAEADQPAQHLSAGQKRRLGLARVWLSGRTIWVLDEPTVSLDRAQIALFEARLAAHLSAGGIVITSTHIDMQLPNAHHLDLGAAAYQPKGETDPFLAEAF